MSLQISDFLVIGDIYILNSDTPKEQSSATKELPKQVEQLKSIKETIKRSVTETIRPGVIHRPTAGELLAKDEPEIKKEADNALRETLEKVPELVAAKKYLQEQTKT